jgi:hypothetical protein
MYTTTAKTNVSKPLIVTGREILAGTRQLYKLSFRCETHGKKGRKSRAEVSRRAIREQY